MELAAFVLGIISILVSFGGAFAGCSWLGCISGILAIIFGATGLKSQGDKHTYAKAGLVMGIISLFGGIILTIICLVLIGGTILAAASFM